MLTSAQLLADGAWAVTGLEVKTVIAAFFVGIVVGLTGMGGGALMTPALIFLGVGDAVDRGDRRPDRRRDLQVRRRDRARARGLAQLRAGQVADHRLGADGPARARHLVRWVTDPATTSTRVLKMCIGFALLFAAATYALRLYINLRRRAQRRHPTADREPADPADPDHAGRRRSAACWSASPASARAR